MSGFTLEDVKVNTHNKFVFQHSMMHSHKYVSDAKK